MQKGLLKEQWSWWKMSNRYVLGIDQSTQGTKALLFDINGKLIERCDLSHKQIVNEQGWVSHDGTEIYNNILALIPMLVEKAAIDKSEIACIGISNQRETSIAWDKQTGNPVDNAIVWQCARAKAISDRLKDEGYASLIKEKTGMTLSPYFPAAKIAWILEEIKEAKEKEAERTLMYGTMDSYLIYRLTNGKAYKTDYSNASRTQLFNLFTLKWDEEICKLFGINSKNLPEVCDSDADYGETDFGGYLEHAIPILGVLGDSQGALFGQGCHKAGMVKATYGTGSSIMMNTGEKPILSQHGLVASLAWGFGGNVNYVLEGNLNYTGAVISWLKKDLELISSEAEAEALALIANPSDEAYIVPAFTGLGAPYWKNDAKAVIVGMTRTTKRPEITKAALDCIAYQITDVGAMALDSNITIRTLLVDGGPTKNEYLMQFQSNLLGITVGVPNVEEFSGMGVAYVAGIRFGMYNKDEIFETIKRKEFLPNMNEDEKNKKYKGWKEAIKMVLND
jgi:glycerol kinase